MPASIWGHLPVAASLIVRLASQLLKHDGTDYEWRVGTISIVQVNLRPVIFGVDFGVSTWPLGCDTPSPFSARFPLGEHGKWRCNTPPPPHKRGISAILARYHMKWGVSRIGPLS